MFLHSPLHERHPEGVLTGASHGAEQWRQGNGEASLAGSVASGRKVRSFRHEDGVVVSEASSGAMSHRSPLGCCGGQRIGEPCCTTERAEAAPPLLLRDR